MRIIIDQFCGTNKFCEIVRKTGARREKINSDCPNVFSFFFIIRTAETFFALFY
jgi:hypothetical protein